MHRRPFDFHGVRVGHVGPVLAHHSLRKVFNTIFLLYNVPGELCQSGIGRTLLCCAGDVERCETSREVGFFVMGFHALTQSSCC
jgi:hypothetical protein